MLGQIIAVTGISLRSLPQRLGSSLVIVIGIAGVVAVLLSVLAMALSFTRTLEATGRPDRAIVLRGGSISELGSFLPRAATITIADAPGVGAASADAVVLFNLKKREDASEAQVTLRGIGPRAFAVRPELKLVAGRMFRPAVHEVIVGRAIRAQFRGVEIGDRLHMREGDWTVVGLFESGGDSHESEVMADVETLLSAYQRNAFQSVLVRLDNQAAFDKFKDALTTNPTLTVEVKREQDYYADTAKPIGRILFFVAYVVGGIMAVGAVFGALNTMYSAVSARTREIATLRAIGFGGAAVVTSVFVEALLLALAGSLLGALLAWLFFNGNVISTFGGNFSQLVFRLEVTPGLVLQGVIWAWAIGLIGGLFPAIRAARLPVAAALGAV